MVQLIVKDIWLLKPTVNILGLKKEQKKADKGLKDMLLNKAKEKRQK
jgi:hypothetical protein